MENFNNMNIEQKELALENELDRERSLLNGMSNPMKIKFRKKYIKDLESRLKDLLGSKQ